MVLQYVITIGLTLILIGGVSMENENKIEIEVVKKRKINKKIIIGLFLIVMLFFLSPFLFPQTIIKIDLAYNKWMSERVFKDLEYNSIEDVEKYIENNKEKFISDLGESTLLNDFEKIKNVNISEVNRKDMIFKYNTIFVRTDEGKNEIAIYISSEKIYLNMDLLEKDRNLFAHSFNGLYSIFQYANVDVDVVHSYLASVGSSDPKLSTVLLMLTFNYY